MTKQSTIIHIEFKTNGSHFYFGSISAAFALFTTEDIGVSRSRLYQFDIEAGKPYENRNCIIRKGPLYRKHGNRTNPSMLNSIIK